MENLKSTPTAELLAELQTRQDFRGAVAWQAGEDKHDWRWWGINCAPGILFLEMAHHLLVPKDAPPVSEPPADSA